MERQQIIDRLLEIAEDADEDQLLEMTVASTNGDLYEAANSTFGSWDAALACALCESVRQSSKTSSRSSTRSAEENVTRTISKASRNPLLFTTENGLVFTRPGLDLDVTESPQHLELPTTAGPIISITSFGNTEGLVGFTDQGQYFAIQPNRIPKWDGSNAIRGMASIVNLESDESIQYLLPRRALFEDRVIHITSGGKGKASDAEDYVFALDRKGRTAFYLNDDDEPVTVFSVSGDTGIFCASALGRGIHFPNDELRSMGQKAVGVKVMKVEESNNEIVGAFPANNVNQVAVVTEDGYGKRVDFSGFTQQGRAGAGRQLARLNRGDRITAVAECSPSKDLVICTDRNRVHRRPATTFESMGRPAKGNKVINLADDEQITCLECVPCGSEDT